MNLLKKDYVSFRETRMSAVFVLRARQRLVFTLGLRDHGKIPIALHIAHNLVLARKVGRTVADGRKPADEQRRVATWRLFVKAGFALECVGKQSLRKVTRYYATKKLMNLFKESHKVEQLLDIRLDRNGQQQEPSEHALVIVKEPKHKGKKKRVLTPLFQMISIMWEENIVSKINESNAAHSWLAFNADGTSYEPNIHLRSIRRLLPFNPVIKQSF